MCCVSGQLGQGREGRQQIPLIQRVFSGDVNHCAIQILRESKHIVASCSSAEALYKCQQLRKYINKEQHKWQKQKCPCFLGMHCYPLILNQVGDHRLRCLMLKNWEDKWDSGGFLSRGWNQGKQRGWRPAGLVVSIVSFGCGYRPWLAPCTQGKANLKSLARTLQVVCEVPKDRKINHRALGEKKMQHCVFHGNSHYSYSPSSI